MRRLWRNNSLSIMLFGLFLGVLVGQSVAGHRTLNQERADHGQPAISYLAYLRSGHVVEAVFEHWESEFLQMGAYVAFTACLHQRGSAESKSLDERQAVDDDPRESRDDPAAPWPVRPGGRWLEVYSYSLTISLLLLFVGSFVLHLLGSLHVVNQEQLAHGGAPVSRWHHLTSATFWFESLQNWQSEFFSVGAIVVLSIWLRQKGSPESKPVAAPHHQTGG